MTGQTLYELYLGVFRGPFPVKWAELPETSQRDWGRLSDAVFDHLGMGVRISISDPKPAFPIPAGSRIDIDFKGIGGSVSSLVPPVHTRAANRSHCLRDPSPVGACAGPGQCSCECSSCLCPVCGSTNECECGNENPPTRGVI